MFPSLHAPCEIALSSLHKMHLCCISINICVCVLTLVAFCSMTISCWSIAFYVTITRQKYLFLLYIFSLPFSLLFVTDMPLYLSLFLFTQAHESFAFVGYFGLHFIYKVFLWMCMQLDLNGEANFIFEKFTKNLLSREKDVSWMPFYVCLNFFSHLSEIKNDRVYLERGNVTI